MREIDSIIENVFGKVRLTYPVDGSMLKREREALGVSRKDFAELCKWTIDFQIKLEVSGLYISCFQRDRIVIAFIVCYTVRKI